MRAGAGFAFGTGGTLTLTQTRGGWKLGLTPLLSLRSKAHKVIREILPYIWFQFAQFSKFDFEFFVSQIACDTYVPLAKCLGIKVRKNLPLSKIPELEHLYRSKKTGSRDIKVFTLISNYCGIILIGESQCLWIVKILLVRGDVISWVTGLRHYNLRPFITSLNVRGDINLWVRAAVLTWRFL